MLGQGVLSGGSKLTSEEVELRGRGGTGEGSRWDRNLLKENGDCERARDWLLDGVSVVGGAWEEDLLCLLFDMERPRGSSFEMLSLVLVRDNDRFEKPGMPPIIELKDLWKPDLEPSLMEGGCEEIVRSRVGPKEPSGAA